MDLTAVPRTTIQTPRTVEADGAWKLEKRATEKSGRAGRVSVMFDRVRGMPRVTETNAATRLSDEAYLDMGQGHLWILDHVPEVLEALVR